MRFLFPVVLLFITSFTLAGASEGEEVETIKAARIAFNEAIARHDIESMQSFLAEDYVATISTGSIDRSRDEHIKSFASHFEQFPDVVYVRSPAEVQISEAYPLAIERGTWVGSRTTDNGPLNNGGEYTAAWKQTENGWLIYSELFVGLYCRGEDC
jgi:ketosteroid isomerase-like protein